MADGLGPELRRILTELGHGDAPDLTNDELLHRMRMRSNKTLCAAALSARLRIDPELARRAPVAFSAHSGEVERRIRGS